MSDTGPDNADGNPKRSDQYLACMGFRRHRPLPHSQMINTTMPEARYHLSEKPTPGGMAEGNCHATRPRHHAAPSAFGNHSDGPALVGRAGFFWDGVAGVIVCEWATRIPIALATKPPSMPCTCRHVRLDSAPNLPRSGTPPLGTVAEHRTQRRSVNVTRIIINSI